MGEADLDLNLGGPLVLLAKVVQGNRAVIGATVTAFVNRLICQVVRLTKQNLLKGMTVSQLWRWSSRTMVLGPTEWQETDSMQNIFLTLWQIRYLNFDS